MNETLAEKQKRFVKMLVDFLGWLHANGYEVTLGEAWRAPETAAIYAKDGRGVANSLHCERLAVDLNLFRGGRYLRETEEYQEAGEHWESLGGSWGGRFRDGNHFSLAHGGRR